jgi:hypothetical protein
MNCTVACHSCIIEAWCNGTPKKDWCKWCKWCCTSKKGNYAHYLKPPAEFAVQYELFEASNH